MGADRDALLAGALDRIAIDYAILGRI